MEPQRILGPRERKVQLIAALLVALLCYAAFSKFSDYQGSRKAMLNQTFDRELALILVWLIPVVELLIAGLLLYLPTRIWGLRTATLLMACFSAYLLLANNGAFARTPCGCGGILGKMDYRTHLVFNLCFVALGLWGIYLSRRTPIYKWFHPRERRSEKP